MSVKKTVMKKFKVTAGTYGEFEVEAKGVVSAKKAVAEKLYFSRGAGLSELSASMLGWKVVKK